MSAEELLVEARRARRRRALRRLPLVATLALTSWAFWPEDPLPARRVLTSHVLPLAVPVVVPVVLQPELPAAREACPTPDDRVPARITARLPERVDRLAAAPSSARWIVAWNARHLLASWDGGQSFHRVLEGPGRVRDASFDCFGRVIAVRGDRIGLLDGQREVWQAMPGARAVVGGGPHVAILRAGPPRLALSHDGGLTWSQKKLLSDMNPDMDMTEGAAGVAHADGSMELGYAWADCMNDGLTWFQLRGGHLRQTQGAMAEGGKWALYPEVALAERWWVPLEGEDHNLEQDFPDYVEPLPGPSPVIAMGDRAYPVERGRIVGAGAPFPGEPQAVDRAGRLWSLVAGQPRITWLRGRPDAARAP